MKIVYYLCYALIVNSFIGTVWAYPNSSLNTSLISHIGSNKRIAEPKFSFIQSQGNIKFASVSFIANDSQLKDKKISRGVGIKPVKCPTGQTFYNGQCVTTCDTLKYPYTIPFSAEENVSPTCAEVVVCNSSDASRYGCTSCREGYVHKGNKCEATDCNDYPLNSLDLSKGTKGGCKICGSETKCRYASCNQGYDLSGGDCIVHECEPTKYSYSPEIKPDYNIGTPIYCYTGKTSLWGYGSCRSGYSLSNGVCIKTCNYKSMSALPNCAVSDFCTRDGTTYYACKECATGYYLSDETCLKGV